MDSDCLPVLLKEWTEETPIENDAALMLLDETERVENRHRQILDLSSELEEAFYQLIKTK